MSPIFALISFLIVLIRGHATPQQKPPSVGPKPSPFQQPWHPQAISPELLILGRWVFLVFALLVVLFVVRAILRRWYARSESERVEEVREALDARSLLAQRWREWWNRWRHKTATPSLLEPLDPGSVRARYRELLSALAVAKDDLARMPAETPAEYEVRLLAHLEKGTTSSQNMIDNIDMPTDTALLNELTHAYTRERYGGKQTDDRQRTRLRTWVPHLVMRLTSKAPTHTALRR